MLAGRVHRATARPLVGRARGTKTGQPAVFLVRDVSSRSERGLLGRAVWCGQCCHWAGIGVLTTAQVKERFSSLPTQRRGQRFCGSVQNQRAAQRGSWSVVNTVTGGLPTASRSGAICSHWAKKRAALPSSRFWQRDLGCSTILGGWPPGTLKCGGMYAYDSHVPSAACHLA